MLLRIGQNTSDLLSSPGNHKASSHLDTNTRHPVMQHKISLAFVAAIFPYCLVVWPIKAPNFNTGIAIVSPILDLDNWLSEMHRRSFMRPPWYFTLLVLALGSSLCFFPHDWNSVWDGSRKNSIQKFLLIFLYSKKFSWPKNLSLQILYLDKQIKIIVPWDKAIYCPGVLTFWSKK